MNILDDLVESKRLANKIYDDYVAMMDKTPNLTPREHIVEWVKACIANGELCLRSEQGNRTAIAKAIKEGLLFPCSFASVMATNEEVRDKFEDYIDSNRILDANRLAVRKALFTDYAIRKAVESKEIARIDDFGDKAAIYIV